MLVITCIGALLIGAPDGENVVVNLVGKFVDITGETTGVPVGDAVVSFVIDGE